MAALEDLSFRPALRDDIPAIVKLLADDVLGRKRERAEDPLPPSYYLAFERIDADENNELHVVLLDDTVVGVLQLTFIPTITYQGGMRAQIEGVRISPKLRGRGVGQAFIRWAIDRARDRRCHLVQLTTDRKRPHPKAFYERLGFVASHEGMKLHMEERD